MPSLQDDLMVASGDSLTVDKETRSGTAPGLAVDYDIQVHSSLEAVREAWEALERDGDAYAFQTFRWMRCWYDEVASPLAVEAKIVVVRGADNRTLAILPFGIREQGGLRYLIWLGGTLADYLGPLLCKDFSNLVGAAGARRIFDSVKSRLGRYDLVFFERQPEWIGAQRNPFVFAGAEQHTCSAHSTRLASDLVEFLKLKRTAKWRSKERRKERRLAEHGEVNFVVAGNSDEAAEILPVMMRQKSVSYQDLGARDLFAEEEYRRFVEKITGESLADGFVFLCALTIGERTEATFWGLVYKQRLYHLLPTYEKDELTRYAPGNWLLRYMFDWAMQHDVDVFDFTSGDDEYKFLWCDEHLALFDYIRGHSIRGKVYVAMIRLRRRIKLMIKSNPALLKLARAIRARLR